MSKQPGTPERTFDGIPLPTRGLYDVDPIHTFVMFSVRHLVVGRVDGRLLPSEGQFTVVATPKPLSLRSIQMMMSLLAQILDDAVADKLREGNHRPPPPPTISHNGCPYKPAPYRADLTILDDRDLTEIQVYVQRDRPHRNHLPRTRSTEWETPWANDTDGSALAAQPDKSQGRPLINPGSTRPSSKNRPAHHAFPLRAPVPVTRP